MESIRPRKALRQCPPSRGEGGKEEDETDEQSEKEKYIHQRRCYLMCVDRGDFCRGCLLPFRRIWDRESRVKLLTNPDLSKADRLRETIKHHIGPIAKSELLAMNPDISDTTVQRTLANLLKQNEIKNNRWRPIYEIHME